jgi:Xaa-Pro dipeptidase
VVYKPGVKPTFVYYQPVDYWHKVADAPHGYWTPHFDIKMIASLEEAKELMPAGRVAFVGEWDDTFESWGFAERNPGSLMARLHYDRTRKTPYEVACMRAATELGVRAHRAAESAFRSGASEFEIHLAYLAACGHMEHELPYGNIIATNQNGSTLHYMDTDRRRLPDSERHSFLIDAGAQVHGYACDITRTYAARDGEFKELVDAVDAMQQEICSEVAPGVDYKDIHIGTHHKTGRILSALGFVKCSGEEAFEKKITPAFFPHGVGHLLGLQVHDVAGFAKASTGETIPKPEGHPYLRLTRTIEPGMTFTIEPGIYFITSLLGELRKSDAASLVDWNRVDSFMKYGGVRIEDNLHVTDTGFENLTREEWPRQTA